MFENFSAMAATEKPLTYEEERQRIIEENKRRMEELGLIGAADALKLKTPRKTPSRKSLNLEDFYVETRRSTRAANLPKVSYKETGLDIGLRQTRVVKRPLRRGYVSPAAKTEAAVRAGDIQTTHPSFVKAMLKSHTSGGFWLGLPSDFCTTHFTKDDLIILEDEDSLEWECVYLHHKHGLSGGWRGFSLDHDLEDGDAVVFELVTSTRFKVYITRACASGDLPAQKGTVAKKNGYQYVVKNSENVHVHSGVHKALKLEKGERVGKQVRAKPAKTRTPRSKYISSSDESHETEDDGSEDESESEGESKSEDESKSEGESESESESKSQGESESEDENSVDAEDKSERESDDDILPATKLKEKKLPKSRQQVKILSKSRQIITYQHRRGSSKASTKVAKKKTFVRRVERKTDTKVVRKDVPARQVEQTPNLPPGARVKAVGVCSIARGSAKRKLPAIYPTRKYSFFGTPKSVKVH